MSFQEWIKEQMRAARPKKHDAPPWKQMAMIGVAIYAVIHMLQFFDPIMLGIFAAAGYILYRQTTEIWKVWNTAKPAGAAEGGGKPGKKQWSKKGK